VTVRRAFLAFALLLACGWAQARLHEEVLALPVTVTAADGKPLQHEITLTLFWDDANPKPAPVLVLNHGRAAEAPQRAAMGRARYSDAARFLVRQGFIVAVPTRIGYGVTGGPDVENSGACNRKNYAPGYAAAAQQTLAVLAAVRQRPDAARDRAVVMGQSYGGTTAATVAALNPPGVQATINFAGGGGGNPKTQPQQPCGPERLAQLFQGYGSTAKVPMLWVYTENDLFFGPEYPRQWHAAYQRAGGRAEFVQFPPHGEDGHGLFTRFPAVWQPKVQAFLMAQGFVAPAVSAAAPPSRPAGRAGLRGDTE
jgi:dienelactone hydrolase